MSEHADLNRDGVANEGLVGDDGCAEFVDGNEGEESDDYEEIEDEEERQVERVEGEDEEEEEEEGEYEGEGGEVEGEKRTLTHLLLGQNGTAKVVNEEEDEEDEDADEGDEDDDDYVDEAEEEDPTPLKRKRSIENLEVGDEEALQGSKKIKA